MQVKAGSHEATVTVSECISETTNVAVTATSSQRTATTVVDTPWTDYSYYLRQSQSQMDRVNRS